MSLNLRGSVPYPVGLTAWEQMMLDALASQTRVHRASGSCAAQLAAALLHFFLRNLFTGVTTAFFTLHFLFITWLTIYY